MMDGHDLKHDPSTFGAAMQQPLLPPQGPPQIFGQYAPDGTLLTPAVPGGLFSDDAMNWNYDDFLDPSDPKRRRIARACDMCRKKKIKCDAKSPKCSHCQNYNTECVFTHVEKKRSPPKGAKYIEGLENRLDRMENLLRLSGLLTEEDIGRADLSALEERLVRQQSGSNRSSPGATPASGATSPTHKAVRRKSVHNASSAMSPTAASPPASKPAASQHTEDDVKKTKTETDPADLAELMCSLMTNNQGETRYIGSSSSFSIFSPRGIQWVNEKTGDTSFHSMINKLSADDNKWYHWKPEVFGDIFARRTFRALPTRDDCISLLSDFFDSFNKMIPLFHEPTFMHLVDRQYSAEPYDSSGWWASLNVALAIAYRMRVMKQKIPGNEEEKGWMYLKNALAVLPELILRNTGLLSVQALLGMSLFLQGTPNPQPSFILVACAVRLAHNIGLHKRGSFFGLNEAEIEQRKRVFWIGYMLDKDICLRSGRPPIQDDDDWNVELPSENPEDDVGNIPLSDGKSKVNLFRLQCRFAVIAAKVYNQLYSTKASKQSDGELLATIGSLDKDLEEWKDSIPLEFRPEHEIKTIHPALILQLVVLHFAYYNCLTTIHRMSVLHGYWSDRLTEYARAGRNLAPLNPRVFSSAALCVAAARASVHLIKYIPQSDFSCVWLIIYFPVSSLVTLFANILQNPQDARARGDLKLMNVVVTFLTRICTEEASGSVRRMLTLCGEFERIAMIVLDKAESEMSTRQKRKQEKEREKLEKQGDAVQTTDILSSSSTEHAKPVIEAASPQEAAMSLRTNEEISAASPNTQLNNWVPSDFPTFSRTQGMESMMNAGLMMENGQFNMAALQALQAQLTNTTNPAWPQQNQHQPPQHQQPQEPIHHQANASRDSNIAQIHTAGLQNGHQMNGHQMNGQMAANTLSPQTPYSDDGGFGQFNNSTGFNVSSFQQPFVPQDMWSMPMTFEWDWNDMMNMAGAGAAPGMGGEM